MALSQLGKESERLQKLTDRQLRKGTQNFKDEGVAVRQVSDGGYIVLGTTTQGALRIITLIKTDKNGKVE